MGMKEESAGESERRGRHNKEKNKEMGGNSERKIGITKKGQRESRE